MDIPDIIIELMKYLSTINLLHFSRINKQNYKLLDMIIKNIDQEKFFKDNEIRILNRSFELYPKEKININNMEHLKYNKKNKKTYALFIIDNTRIKVYINKIKISGTKSRSEFIKMINDLINLKSVVHNLIPISTSLCFNKDLKHKDYKSIRINNCHSHITADILKFDIYNTNISYIAARNSKKINCHYNKFKVFYLTYTRFAF
jgi:hypothetical protein